MTKVPGPFEGAILLAEIKKLAVEIKGTVDIIRNILYDDVVINSDISEISDEESAEEIDLDFDKAKPRMFVPVRPDGSKRKK